MFNIREAFLPEEEASRLYRTYPNLGHSPRKYCPTCHKKGTYTFNGEEHECDCVMQLQLNKHYLASGIGVTYQRLGWDDLVNEDVKSWCRQYLEHNLADRGVGLLLTGSFGSGKTLSATLLLKELVKRGYHCYATTFASMVETYTAGWRDPEDKKYFIRKVVNSDVLLLDDLGKEFKRSNRLAETTFDDVLRTRVQAGRATLLTTNMTKEELGDGYGGAALSLLREVILTYQFSGDDYRVMANKRLLEETLKGEIRPIQ